MKHNFSLEVGSYHTAVTLIFLKSYHIPAMKTYFHLFYIDKENKTDKLSISTPSKTESCEYYNKNFLYL